MQSHESVLRHRLRLLSGTFDQLKRFMCSYLFIYLFIKTDPQTVLPSSTHSVQYQGVSLPSEPKNWGSYLVTVPNMYWTGLR